VYSNEDKNQCGQWLGCREESFINIELIIRGKEAIDESFKDMVRGELMDGDNKLMCETCNEKKAVTRRQCLSVLPNLFILHLKRFDLDFTTFETVKLNNKIEFGTTLNVLSYTQRGLDILEGGGQENDKDKGSPIAVNTSNSKPISLPTTPTPTTTPDYESKTPLKMDVTPDMDPEVDFDQNPNPVDFEYQLQGVLVHMGIAQGGHYYSFIRDCSGSATTSTSDSGMFTCNRIEEASAATGVGSSPGSGFEHIPTESNNPSEPHKWYRFDDDEVTDFNPDHIPIQCFGGSVEGENKKYGIEEERCSNALMLFYSKVNTDCSATIELIDKVIADANKKKKVAENGVDSAGDGCLHSRTVDGYEAFSSEIRENNDLDLRLSYVLDQELHYMVRELMQVFWKCDESVSISVESIKSTLTAVQFASHVLFDIVLHSRERNATQQWLENLMRLITHSARLNTKNNGAIWFVYTLLQEGSNSNSNSNTDSTGCCWLQDYLLYCTDAMARNAFMQVLVHCLGVLATDMMTKRDCLGNIALTVNIFVLKEVVSMIYMQL